MPSPIFYANSSTPIPMPSPISVTNIDVALNNTLISAEVLFLVSGRRKNTKIKASKFKPANIKKTELPIAFAVGG